MLRLIIVFYIDKLQFFIGVPYLFVKESIFSLRKSTSINLFKHMLTEVIGTRLIFLFPMEYQYLYFCL